jgi:hypothetical protein
MKLRLVRVLSIGGVLAATTAAAGYGQVFGSGPDPATASSSTTSGSGSTGSSTAATTPAAAPVPVSPAPVAGSATQFSYVAGDAATIVLDSAGGTLRLVSFVPNPGWFTIRLDQPSATDLDVSLESPSGQVRFTAGFVNGAIVAHLQVGAGSGTSVPGNSAPGNSAPGNTSPGGGDDNGGDDDNSGSGSGGGDDNGGDDNSGSGSGGGDDSGSDD